MFNLTAVPGTGTSILSSYQAWTNPQAVNQTGVRSFCSIADAVVRYSSTSLGTCGGTETPLQ